MEDNIKQLEDLLSGLRSNLKDAIEEAYQRGWDDGVAKTPDYKKFHEHHKEAQHYGEDGELVVVSGKYGMERAVDEIYKLLKPDYEVTRDEVWDNTHAGKVALGTSDEESDYYVARNRNGIFDAWIWKP